MAIFNKKSVADLPRRRLVKASSNETIQPKINQNTFRRNRTLTGSTSNYVSSSSHSQPDMSSPRSHAHHLTKIRRRIGSILLVVLVGGLLVYWLLTQLTAQVNVVFSDTTMVRAPDTSRYEKALNDYLGIHPLGRLRFLLDINDMSQYMTVALPEVDNVVEVSMGRSIGETAFTLTVRQPVAGWKIGSKQYYVDAKGVAFERNYYNDPGVQIIDQTGVTLEQGTLVASNRFLGFVGRVVALAKDRNYTVTDAILPAGTTRQLDIRLSGVAPLVKLSIDRSVGEQIEDMARSLDYLASQGLSPEYIDVRVSGKAFYK